ncbi:MAG: response regulator [Syntrophales bacterium]|nr:response regulator [Syntrophales bacterium]
MSFNVMVIEDSITMRSIIRKVLTLSRIPVDKYLETESAKEALTLLSKYWVDLIITDLNLPGMSGIEMIRVIKSQEETRDIPVIVVSASCSEEQISEAINLGVDGFLNKPFRPEALCSLVREVLNVNAESYFADIDERSDF